MKYIYFVLFCITLFIAPFKTLTSDKNDKEFCSAAKREEQQCGMYAFNIVKPLLDFIRKTQSKTEHYENIIEAKDKEIKEIQVRVTEIKQKFFDNAQKDKTIEVFQKLDDSNTDYIRALKSQIEFFKTAFENLNNNCSSSRNESNRVQELERTIAVNSQTIKELSSQIIKSTSQIDSEREKIKNCENQSGNQTALIRLKNELISNLQAANQNLAISLNETQFNLTESSLENSCVPFSNSPGIHRIKIPGIDPFNVLCGSAATNTGWIVIQQRINGKEDFYRDWASYRAGFGSFTADFFLGLEKIYRLTANQRHELYIHLERFNGEITYATYEHFAIAGEEDQYKLINVDGFSGNTTASDYMECHKGSNFYTLDRDSSNSCAFERHGGWWYDCCAHSNLNGKYLDAEISDYTSMYWYKWRSLKKVQMLIRPRIYK